MEALCLILHPDQDPFGAVLDGLGWIITGVDDKGERKFRLPQLLPVHTLSEAYPFILDRLTVNEERSPQWNKSEGGLVLGSGDSSSPLVIQGCSDRSPVIVEFRHNKDRLRSHVVISGCHKATIYVLEPCMYAHIVGCTETTIVLGPVLGVTTLEHCDKVQMQGLTNQIRVNNCLDVKLNVSVGERPCVMGDCRGIAMGPFNVTQWPDLEVTLSRIQLESSLSKWRSPVIMDADGLFHQEDGQEDDDSFFSIQPVDTFHLDPVPEFSLLNKSTRSGTVVVPLPQEYQARVLHNSALLESTIDQLNLAIDQGGAPVLDSLQASFKEWMLSSGNAAKMDAYVRADVLFEDKLASSQ